VLAPRHGTSTAIMIAVAMEEPEEATVIVATVLDPLLVLPPPILIGLGAALHADQAKQGNGRRGGPQDRFCAHAMFLSG
jgi:hypothetical protein